MRRTSVLPLLLCLSGPSLAAAPSAQVIAKPGILPGAVVCPDYRAIQAAVRGFTARRGPGAYVEYYGCSFISAGTLMTVVGEDPGGAPVVRVTLPDGRTVTGVTLRDMVESVVIKPRSPSPGRPAPAPGPDALPAFAAAAPATTGAPAAPPKPSKSNVPFPALHNSPDTLCEPSRQCNDQEFAEGAAANKERWAMMPPALQKKCASSPTLPALDECIVTNTPAWSKANPGARTPWMPPEGEGPGNEGGPQGQPPR